MRRQLDFVIEKCAAAMSAGIPILYLETEDMTLLDVLLRSERLLPFWYKDCDEGWLRLDHKDKVEHIRPANISIVNGALSSYFDDINTTNGEKTYTRNSFVVEHTGFKYSKTGVKGEVPMVIACRNFKNDAETAKILERLVSEHLSALPGDAILRRFIILQSPVVALPKGIEPYVEVVTVPHLKDEEIKEIICDFARDEHEAQPYEHLLDSMTVNFRGFTKGKIKEVLRKILLECGSVSDIAVENVSLQIIGDEKKQILQKSGLLKSKELGDKTAAGLECVKEWISSRKKLFENPLEASNVWAIDSPKGILVSGVPGTGKSLLAEEIARILSVPLISMDMGGLLSRYQGESEQNLRRVIHLAESLAPCVLWIDEIEKAFAGAGSSGEADGGTASRNFGTFLTWMQEKRSACFIFATANKISSLPPEFLRRGRFDRKFFTFMPTKQECKYIFQGVIGGKNDVLKKLFEPEIFTDKFLDEILSFCGKHGKFMTGADIQGIVDDAKFLVYLDSLNHKQNNASGYLYKVEPFKQALKDSIMEAQTYGETDMDKIVECLFGLARNHFAPSSKTNLIDIRKVNIRKKTIDDYAGEVNGYDELLYKQIQEMIEEYQLEEQNKIKHND